MSLIQCYFPRQNNCVFQCHSEVLIKKKKWWYLFITCVGTHHLRIKGVSKRFEQLAVNVAGTTYRHAFHKVQQISLCSGLVSVKMLSPDKKALRTKWLIQAVLDTQTQ